MEEVQMDGARLLRIIGIKEYELDLLRERLSALEKEKKKESKPLKADPVK